jgi:hypothetical protein
MSWPLQSSEPPQLCVTGPSVIASHLLNGQARPPGVAWRVLAFFLPALFLFISIPFYFLSSLSFSSLVLPLFLPVFVFVSRIIMFLDVTP